jgi:ribonuclease P protein subunit POP4
MILILEMYSQLPDEEHKSLDNPSNSAQYSESNIDRQKFLDKFLSEHLKPEKQKEKQSLCEKIKYKKHQLEVANRELKEELKGKRKNLKKRNPLTCRQKKELNLYKLKSDEPRSYNQFLLMNQLWQQYINKTFLTENLDFINEDSVLNVLKHADFHGSILKVVKSKCKNLISLSGIVLQEKKNVFVLLTKNKVLKTVPKLDNLFELEINGIKFILIGSNMCVKPELRTTKYIKPKNETDII